MNHSIIEFFTSKFYKFFLFLEKILPTNFTWIFLKSLLDSTFARNKSLKQPRKKSWIHLFLHLHHHIINRCYGGYTEYSFNVVQSSENCVKYCLISQGNILTNIPSEENYEKSLVLFLISKYELQCYGSYPICRIIKIDCMSTGFEE